MLCLDEQVRHAIERVFVLWRRLGSARQVVMELAGEEQVLPRRSVGQRRVRWVRVSCASGRSRISVIAWRRSCRATVALRHGAFEAGRDQRWSGNRNRARDAPAGPGFHVVCNFNMRASSSMALGCITVGWTGGVRRVALRVPAAITLSVLALLVCGASAVAAAEPGSLTFATAEPLTLTWAQLLHGKSIEVCNGGAATVPRLRVVPEDFQFTRDGGAVAPSQVLTVKPPSHSVRAGECAPVHIALKSEAATRRIRRVAAARRGGPRRQRAPDDDRHDGPQERPRTGGGRRTGRTVDSQPIAVES